MQGKPLRIASVNVNGIRAAYRRGMEQWLEQRDVDILCLQEVRAPDDVVRSLLGQDRHIHHAEAEARGRAGVLIASRQEPTTLRTGVGDSYFDTAGRWVEADFDHHGTSLTVVSAYVHSGEVGTPKQDDKYRFLDALGARLAQLRERGGYAVVTGDLNVGHTTRDIRNWKSNVKKAGFLPEERAYFDRYLSDESGFVDVARSLAGDVDGPYTWWSWRGKAFDNDTGWRIDYQLATTDLAARAVSADVDRATGWDTRFSDHAPLVVDYQI
ncbi:exodeoxyribonuclease III [Arthrobacter echini]|uniref:Exodeoxyribonuclease III n=1 Tax=Arthrobacter echini TaxID=1529066 RepID=A0A4S5E929_9MICC|nr:exodeoxyribonuclease III [Arthrobacter echini]THJ68033.1 exodeoxyribonuclease III [Arthrobacter echini]